MSKNSKKEEVVVKKNEDIRNPYDSADLLSRILSIWIFPFLLTGCRTTYKGPEDIYRVPVSYDTKRVYFRYNKKYDKVKDYKTPLFCSIMRWMWKKFLILEILQLTKIGIQLTTPFVQRYILEHLFPTDDSPEWIEWRGTGFILVGVLFIMSIIEMYLKKFADELSNKVRVTLMNAILAKVYNKLLNFSSKSLTDMSNQSFVTYVNVEVGMTVMAPIALLGVYKQPIILIGSVVLLFVFIGEPAFFIIIVVIFIIPIYIILSIIMFIVYVKLIKFFSENTKFISGVLRGIRVIKSNVWEGIFLERIMKRRKKFVIMVILYFVLIISFSITSTLSPVVMQIVLFTVTFALRRENFTISKIFPSLTYIMLFSSAITMFPSLIIACGKGFTSLFRVEKLLKMEEFDLSFYSVPEEEEYEDYSEDDDDDGKKKKKEEEEDDDDDKKKKKGVIRYDADEYPIRMWDSCFEWYPKPEKKGKKMKMKGKNGDDEKKKNKCGKCCSGLVSSVSQSLCFLCTKMKKKKEKGEDIELKEVGEEEEKKKIGKLENIGLAIKKGSLVAVIGEVGSGKSMLLKSLVGELKKTGGHVDVKGTVSYVAQSPWVINETVKNNVLFGREMKEELYQASLNATDLPKDISLFPDGDDTEVGERGGQKQRIALARGFYADTDVYLLDDISSAVDPGVARVIFDEGICGVIKDKTRLLVTNQLSWLIKTDYIIALENGKIREEGRYEELMDIEGGFVKYLVDKFASVEEGRMKEAVPDMGGQDEKKVKKKEEEEEEDEGEEIDVVEEVVSEEVVEIEESSKKKDEGKKEKKEEDKDAPKKGSGLMMKEEVKEGQVGICTIWFYFQTFGCCNCTCSAIATLLFLTMFTLVHFTYKHMLQVWLSFWTTEYFDLPDEVYLSVYAFIGFTQPLLGVIRYFLLIVFSLVSGVRITRKVFRRLMSTPISYWETTPLGRVLNRLSGDQFKTDFLIISVNGFIRTIFELIFSLVFVGITNWFTLILILPLFPIYIVIQEFYRRSSRQVKRIQAVSRSPMIALLQETVDGIHRIRTYGAQEHFMDRFCEKINHNMKVNFMSFQLNIWLSYVLTNVSCFVILFAGLMIVGFKDWELTGLNVLAGLSFSHLLSFSGRLSSLVQQVVDIEQNFNSVERLSYYAKDLKIENPAVIPSNRPPSGWASSNKFSIKFRDVSMRYRKELPLVLNKISFTVYPNEKIGIVGRSGSGKTSLFNTLFRINEPEKGSSIVIDGVNVVDNFGLHDLRNIMSIIPQDPYLFKGTIRFNIDPSRTIKSEEEIWSVLEKCRLKETVKAYEDQLNHELDGKNLSAGEKQLVCLARSMIRKSRILCLDEATANIDLETETYIRDTIENEFKDCIVFTIAHRIHTIAKSDRVMVLEKGGEIVEFDSPIVLARNEDSAFFKILDELGEEGKRKLMEIMQEEEGEVDEKFKVGSMVQEEEEEGIDEKKMLEEEFELGKGLVSGSKEDSASVVQEEKDDDGRD